MSDLPSGWQPIETAPRDGTRIVLYTAGGYAFTAEWVQDACVDEDDLPTGAWLASAAANCPPSWTDGICWAFNADDEPSDPPTHWCPLPDPPHS